MLFANITKHINCLNLTFLIIILQKSLQPHDKKMLINQKIFIPVTRRKVNMTFDGPIPVFVMGCRIYVNVFLEAD